MSQTDINNNAKQELQDIINDLFISNLESKLDEKNKFLVEMIDKKSKGITSNINTVSDHLKLFNTNCEERDEELLKKVEDNSESSKATNEHILKNNEEIASIQNKLTEIQNKSLADILTSAIRIIDDQKLNSENLLSKLDGIIISQRESIEKNKFDNVTNQNNFKILLNKINIAFISLLMINIIMVILLIMNCFFK